MKTITQIVAATTAISVASLPVFADTKSFDLDGFDEITISSGIEADITIGPDFSIVAEARDNDTLDNLEISVRGHTLYIDRDSSVMEFLFGDHDRLTVTITLPELNEIDVNSGVSAYVTGAFGDTISAEASSGADIELENITASGVSLAASSGADIEATGRCESLEVDVSSGADIDAKALECLRVDASSSSGSQADVFASDSIKSRASSGGDVNVWGSPDNTDISNSSGGDTDIRN